MAKAPAASLLHSAADIVVDSAFEFVCVLWSLAKSHRRHSQPRDALQLR
jgi:hypothetical protein